MTQNPPRTSSYLKNHTPDPAPPIVSAVDVAATTASTNTAQLSHSAPPARHPEAPKQATDFLSDKATAAFIRRTLCAHHVSNSTLFNGEKAGSTPRPIEELLPPLTSSNEVDLQLYAIIAVVLKEFVYTWYTKITPDHVFVDEVIQIIAHCTRALEQRLRKADLEALLLDEIPGLLDSHVKAYRVSRRATGYQSLASDPREVYHTLNPHPALSPVPYENDPSCMLEQGQNEAAWRQLLVQGVLAVLLPTEDLENGCLRALVAEVFSETILGNGISGKACEGWLIWEAITKVADVLRPRIPVVEEVVESKLEPGLNRLEKFGLLSSSNQTTEPAESYAIIAHEPTAITTLLWLVVQYTIFAVTAIRAVILAIATSSSLPARSMTGSNPWSPIVSARQSPLLRAEATTAETAAPKRPILSMSVWSCASHLLELESRMPWLAGFVSLLHHGALVGPGQVGRTDGMLDR
ncbi:hypothetical protein W97_02652 [Coniosporium apollinis CBS 100218]|uniref:PXA domain-containing protein n=1 Tax=Coniosporium apollinis (strain CBS 100218) TaxID=1168221 RepID=R7YNB8_CONA1|nr:uncharacterized protein W97_02652 [Coniosporium apollinis CBS 100218]EON63425.1 hypothetical protein W97_02652 [Coniosporium apollinis CBS 100218]